MNVGGDVMGFKVLGQLVSEGGDTSMIWLEVLLVQAASC